MSQWIWSDGVETWTMHRNPRSMTSPIPGSTIETLGRAIGAPLARRTPKLTDWSFSGTMRAAEYATLVYWCSKKSTLTITDHLGRAFTVRIHDFKPAEQKASRLLGDKYAYTVSAYVLGGPA